MVRGDARITEDMAQTHDRIGLEVGLVHPAAQLDPGLLAGRHLDLEAPIVQERDIGTKGAEQGFHP